MSRLDLKTRHDLALARLWGAVEACVAAHDARWPLDVLPAGVVARLKPLLAEADATHAAYLNALLSAAPEPAPLPA